MPKRRSDPESSAPTTLLNRRRREDVWAASAAVEATLSASCVVAVGRSAGPLRIHAAQDRAVASRLPARGLGYLSIVIRARPGGNDRGAGD